MRYILLFLFPIVLNAQIVSVSGSSGSAMSVVSPETFGGKADFRRNTVSTAKGSSTIVCSSCSFTNSDIGKVVAIKTSRYDSAYIYSAITMNAVITNVTSSTVAILDSTLDKSNASTEMLWGTNNFDAIQQSLDYAYNNNIPTVYLKSGTYYIVPKKAAVPPVIYSGNKGLAIRGSVSLVGQGMGLTTLKFGEEDVMRKNLSSIYGYTAIYLVGNGSKTVKLMTIEAPDRISTETAYSYLNCISTESLSNIKQNVTLEDLYCKGQWSETIYSSLGGKWNSSTGIIEYYNDYRYSRLKLECRRQAIVMFTNDGPTKRLYATDIDINGGGASNVDTLYGVANIVSGSNVLTILDSTFSWYNFVSQYSNSRKPYVQIGGSYGSFSTTVSSIVNPNTAILTDNSPTSYSNDTLKWYLNNDYVEGHATYIHPNVSQKWKNIKMQNVLGYSFHIYSGGGQPGKVQFFEFDNVEAKTPSGGQPSCLISGDNVNLTSFDKGGFATIKNCINFSVLCTAKAKIYDSKIGNQFADTTEFYNCTGGLVLTGTNKKYTIIGCNFDNAYFHGTDNKIIVLNSSAINLSLDASYDPTDGMLWNGGSIGGINVQNMTTSMLNTTGLIKISNIEAVRPYYYFMSYPSLTSSDRVMFKKKFLFSNINMPIDVDIFGFKNDPRGLFLFRNAVNPTPILTTVSLPVNKENEYENWVKASFPQNYNKHKLELSGTTSLQALYPIGLYANLNLYNNYLSGMYHFNGICDFTLKDTMKFTYGGLFRLQFSGARDSGEVVTLRLNPDKVTWIEENCKEHFRPTIPSWSGINLEKVYNSSTTGAIYWEYRISTTTISGETSGYSGQPDTLEFNLAHTPYLGFREKTFIDPLRYMSITIPLVSGGNETFIPMEHGQLVGSHGSTGFLRMTDGHVKLILTNPVINSNVVTINYQYISSSSWNAVGTK